MFNWSMRGFNLLLTLALAIGTFGQEHPFLSSFNVTEIDDAIRLDWTMFSGSTCFGIQVFRSFNGLDFEQVGRIEGLCGSVSEPIDYEFVDESPVVFARHYYRLELGVNGFSSIQELVFDQIVEGPSITVYPEGVGRVIIYSQLPISTAATIELFDMQGRSQLFSAVHSGHRVELDVSLKVGEIYIFRIVQNGMLSEGKLFVSG